MITTPQSTMNSQSELDLAPLYRQLRLVPDALQNILERMFLQDSTASDIPFLCHYVDNYLMQLLCLSEDTDSVLQKLSLSDLDSPSKVCGKVWYSGNIFYRCRDCQMSLSSAVCVDCFDEGKHEGHDYFMDKSVCGGACDCGDSTSWIASGFCAEHKGIDENARTPPEVHLPEPHETLLTIILRFLIKSSTTVWLVETETDSSSSCREILRSVGLFLSKLVSRGGPLRQAVIYHCFFPEFVECCLTVICSCEGSIGEGWANTLLAMCVEHSFKRLLAPSYVKFYPLMAKNLACSTLGVGNTLSGAMDKVSLKSV